MKPFLFLGTRAEDAPADSEYAAVLKYTELPEERLVRRRLESEPMGEVHPADWAGIILGGGPFNVSDPIEKKSPVQQRVEAELSRLCAEVIEADTWFLGACYGVGTLGVQRGGVVDRTYGEPVSATRITLTPEGVADPLFGVLPQSFDSFLGHKEAIKQLPRGAVVLASSQRCPVQGFRIGTRVYATQFHPELDVEGLCTRVDAYRHYGYFDPAEAEGLKQMAHAATVTEPFAMLRRFVELADG